MKSVPRSRYAVFFVLAVFGALLDLTTKAWIFGRLGMPGEKGTWWLWQGVVGFQTSLNEGALFGIGQGNVQLFSVMSVVAAAAICLWLFVAGAARQWLVTIACGLITAGIFGNLYDRLGLPGLHWNYPNPPLHDLGEPVFAVRDWILVMIGSFHWPNFNVADSMLVAGAGLIVIHAIWFDSSAKPHTDSTSPSQE